MENLNLYYAAKDFLAANDGNVYGELSINIFGNELEVESIWHSKEENKMYIHVGCIEFEGDLDIDSLSVGNERMIEEFFKSKI